MERVRHSLHASTLSATDEGSSAHNALMLYIKLRIPLPCEDLLAHFSADMTNTLTCKQMYDFTSRAKLLSRISLTVNEGTPTHASLHEHVAYLLLRARVLPASRRPVALMELPPG